ncbi:hypothetical protein NDU88_002409 [Pleurodeles waltl]|uniref:Uncharacterized protein n=1 Tax=Pleurodeles waltl TaxID=8319 RepID=A0AAV7RCM9_PLEWA|nr:hypothetical protein NDU88_002409 [Pleurodeles waltl]
MHAGRTCVEERAIPPVGRSEQTGTCSLQCSVRRTRLAAGGGGCGRTEERVFRRGSGDSWVGEGRQGLLVYRRYSALGWAVQSGVFVGGVATIGGRPTLVANCQVPGRA